MMLHSLLLLPHGMQIIPDLEQPYNEQFRSIHNAMKDIQKQMELDPPDLIILVTPHGLALDDQYLIYQHSEYQGFFYEVSEESVVHGKVKYVRHWQGDSRSAEDLLHAFKEADLPSQALIQGYSEYPLTLAWGETVPLHYTAVNKQIMNLVISIPRSRFSKIHEMQKHLETISSIFHDYVQINDQKISIIISGDLSHVHKNENPYGYHQSGEKYDKIVQSWCLDPSREKLLELLNLQETALSCGMAGISILQYLLEKDQFHNTYLHYKVPTYFGMAVSKWVKT
ncbi:MAG: DODA-type extradiol aromatic ring-opening family dioxygenase [Candidatus Kariarchaeaceae archaeon]|jgi:aromatic ring-opening dioxygenase LigB subunit